MIVNDIFDILDWDRGSYWFNRDEKDMNPYSIFESDGKIIITHNVLGIDKEDLSIKLKKENRQTYIVIEGTTEDKITGKTYSINSRFLVDEKQVDVSQADIQLKNGLLYITMPYTHELKYEKKLSIKD